MSADSILDVFGSLVVIAPHADDEVLGCGGLVARMTEAGLPVCLFIVNPEREERAREAEAAAAFLGADLVLGDFNPGGLDVLPQRILISQVENLLRERQPQAVAVPDPGAYHQDHRAVGIAGLAACRPSGMTNFWRPEVVLGWEEAADAWPPRPMQTPGLTVTLEQRHVDAKIDAMLLHGSQVRDCPSERSVEAIAALARVRGSQAGTAFGEAYHVFRWLL